MSKNDKTQNISGWLPFHLIKIIYMGSSESISVQRGEKNVSIPKDHLSTFEDLRDACAKHLEVAKQDLGHLTYTIQNKVHFITDDLCLQKAKSAIEKATIVLRSDADDITKDFLHVKEVMKKGLEEAKATKLPFDIPTYNEEEKIKVNEFKTEINDELIDKIHGLIPRRHSPTEDPISCFLISAYLDHAKRLEIDFDDIDKTIFGLEYWREQTKATAYEENKQSFPLLFLTLPQDLKNKASFSTKTSYLFSQVQPKKVEVPTHESGLQLADDHTNFLESYAQHIKLSILDGLHHALTLAASHLLTPEQYANILSDRHFSDGDSNFVTEVLKAWFKYGDKVIYYPPISSESGVLPDFDDEQKVGILGDWGTNLQDAYDILDELVINQKATIILHNGGVYHAGFPKEYQGISQKLAQLRKYYPNLRYYTIPGNHDYYTFGGPFYESLPNNNDAKFIQKQSFFCLRNESSTVQFIGLNTGQYDHKFQNHLNPFYSGVKVNEIEAKWAIDKIKNFPGKTIMLTHHQYFSSFESSLGKYTDMGRKNPQLNPLLASQFFEVLPKITCWMWGHEHRFATYKANAFGVNRSILIGNSAYQNDQYDYYDVKYPNGDIEVSEHQPDMEKSPINYGWLNHTAIVLSDFNKQQISAKYVYMTASYTKTSLLLKTLQDKYESPTQTDLFFGKTYCILVDNGLSIAVTNRVFLDSNPTYFQLIDPQDSTSIQRISPGQDVLIKVAWKKNQYMFCDGKGISLGGFSTIPEFQWRIQCNYLRTGEIFQLFNVRYNQPFGATYSREHSEYQLQIATPSRFQFYRIDP